MSVSLKWRMSPKMVVFVMALIHHAFAVDMQFVMSGDVGRISSPNYPNKYPIGIMCRWLISTSHANRILLNFTDFRLEKNKVCLHDYLEITENLGEQGIISAKYCGWGTVTSYLSESNSLELVFMSDKMSIAHRGFSLNWKKVQKNGKPLTTKWTDRPTSATPFIGLMPSKCRYKKLICRVPCEGELPGEKSCEVKEIREDYLMNQFDDVESQRETIGKYEIASMGHRTTENEDGYNDYRKLVIAFSSVSCSIAIMSIVMYVFLWRKGFARFDCFPCKGFSSFKKNDHPSNPAEHGYFSSSTLSATSDNFVHISARVASVPQRLTNQANAVANQADACVNQTAFYQASIQQQTILSDGVGESNVISGDLEDGINQGALAVPSSNDSTASELCAEDVCRKKSAHA